MAVQNRFSARLLSKILDARGWTQGELAKRSGVVYSMVSNHLLGQRRIRDKHLVRYLNALDQHERPQMLAAWLRDNLSPDAIHDILMVAQADPISPVQPAMREEAAIYRVRAEVAAWQPKLEPADRRMLCWWAEQIANGDVELRDVLRAITRKAGYPRHTQ